MARLSTYTSDTVDKSDKLIGTSSGGETKNFVVSDISTFLANTNAAGVAGQITYQYKASSGDKASGTFLGTFSSGSTFANLTSIKVSKYPSDSSLSVVNLLTSYNNNQIILSSIGHPDNFGVYTVSSVAQDGSSDYYDIGLSYVSGNGSLSNDNYYGLNSTSIVASAYATLTGSQTLTNKTLTSPVLNTGVSGTAIKDEDNMSSDSATHLATQQSIKAYVDNQLTASDLDFQGDSGGALSIDLDSETLTLAGGTGLTSTGSSNTITFAVDAAQTGITSIYATDLILGEDSQTAIDFGTTNEIDFKVDNAARLTLTASALYPVTNNQIDLGTSSLEFKDAYFDGTVTADAFAGPLTGDITGNVSGTAATVTGSAQSNITSLGTLTTLTVDNVIINGTTIGHTGDTDLMTVASGVLTVAGEVDATSLDISGDADIDGTLEADAITVNGTALDTHIAGVTVTNATNAAHALVTDNENTNEDNPITFVEGATTSTGNIGLEMDGDFHYNPSTGRLTASQLAGTLQTASQTNITGVGTISTGVWNGTAVASAYLDSDTMHLSVAQTITGEKTIDGSDKLYFRDSAIYVHSDADGYLEMVADTGVSLKIGSDEQIMLTDGAFTPTSDSDVDLGSSSKYWKDSYIDTITTTGNVVVGGNLTVSGTTTTVDSTTVAIADSMLKLAKDQGNSADAVDFGFYGQYGVGGTHKYAGIFRDLSATGDPWTFFDGLQAEPGTTVNTSGTGYDLADISAGGITSADGFTGTLLTAAQANVTSLGTLTTLTVDNVIINGTTIGHTDDTDLITLADGVFTVTGEIDGTTLDISGNADIDGTTNLDDVDIDGNVQLDGTLTVGVDDTGYDVKLFGATSGAYLLWDESDNELETAGGATINIIKDKLKIGGTAVTTTAAELNVLDAVTAGTVTASLGVVVDSNKDIGSFRNITLTGELDAGSLDVSGDADIDGTLEADVLTVDGTNILTGGIITSLGTITQDTVTFTSANANDPLVIIQNTTNDATAAALRFNKNRGADAQDNDMLGRIDFYGYDDGTPSTQHYGQIGVSVKDASSGAEGGEMFFGVANHDGGMENGLVLSDGSADGEIDVTIGSGTSSLTTVAGNATFAGAVTANTGSKITSSSTDTTFSIETTSGSTIFPVLDFVSSHSSAGSRIRVGGTDVISLDKSQNATFAGDVVVGFQSNKFIGSSAGNGLYFDGTGNYGMAVNSTLGLGLIFESDGGTAKDFFIGTGNSDPDSATKLLTIPPTGQVEFRGVGGADGYTLPYDQNPGYSNVSWGGGGVLFREAHDFYLTQNLYYYKTGGAASWRYKYAAGAGILAMSGGAFTFSSVGSGSADAVASLVDKFSITQDGAVSISHGSGDTLTLTKSTTEPSMRFEGDTDKDFVLTISGETFTVTKNDGSTDILTLDHDTGGATFVAHADFGGNIRTADDTVVRTGYDSTGGGPGIQLNYSHASGDYLGNISSEYSSGGIIIGYGCHGKVGAAATFSSSYDNFSYGHSAFNCDGAQFEWWHDSSNSQTTVGSDVPNMVQIMTLTRGGQLQIGNTSAIWGNEKLMIYNTSAEGIAVTTNDVNHAAILTKSYAASTSAHYVLYVTKNNAANVGSITHNDTNTAFNTSSDYRLKEDLKDFSGLEMLSKIKMYDFKWKDTDQRQHGAIAHELDEVTSYAVTGEKDGMRTYEDKEVEEYQGVDYAKLVPILVKSVQEQQTTIEDLKKRIETLEK